MNGIRLRQENVDLSPLIPIQDTTIMALESSSNVGFSRVDQDQESISNFKNLNTCKIYNTCEKYLKAEYSKQTSGFNYVPSHQTHDMGTDEKDIQQRHVVSRSSKQEDAVTDTKNNELKSVTTTGRDQLLIAISDIIQIQEDSLFIPSSGQRNQGNPSTQEDSQIDLFDCDNLSGQKPPSLPGKTKLNSSKRSRDECAHSENITSSRTPLNGFQHSVYMSLENQTEVFKPTNVITHISSNSTKPSPTISDEQILQKRMCETMGNEIRSALSSCVSNTLICKPCVDGVDQSSSNVDYAVRDISACTIPKNLTHSIDDFSKGYQNIITGNYDISLPSKVHFHYPGDENKHLVDTADTASKTSISIMVPGTASDKNELSASNDIAAPILKCEHVPGMVKPSSLKLNYEILIGQMHKDSTRETCSIKKDFTIYSQGTKSSSDLFLNSLEVSENKQSALDLSQTTEASAISELLININRENARQNGSLSSPEVSRSLTHKIDSEDKMLESSCKSERRLPLDHAPEKESYDELYRDHERKRGYLQRLEGLCHQIVSRTDDVNENHRDSMDMESYIHRYESLTARMHAMQKKEKIKLCSSLKGICTSKQKKKALKRQLEYLKLRHQILMDIVNKYGEVKDRLKKERVQTNRKGTLPRRKMPNTRSNHGLKSSFHRPKKGKQSFHCRKGVNGIENENITEDIMNSASLIECVDERQCIDNVSEQYHDCFKISGSSGKGDYVTSTTQRKGTYVNTPHNNKKQLHRDYCFSTKDRGPTMTTTVVRTSSTKVNPSDVFEKKVHVNGKGFFLRKCPDEPSKNETCLATSVHLDVSENIDDLHNQAISDMNILDGNIAHHKIQDSATSLNDHYINLTMKTAIKDDCTTLPKPTTDDIPNNIVTISDGKQNVPSYVITDTIMSKTAPDEENIPDKLNQLSQIRAASHAENEQHQENEKTMNCFPQFDEDLLKESVSIQTFKSAPLAKDVMHFTDANSYVSHSAIEVANQTPIPKPSAAGPPSPCSTQGSSLFLVSSREIIRRVRGQEQQTEPLNINNDQSCEVRSALTGDCQTENIKPEDPFLISGVSKISAKHLQIKPIVSTDLKLEPTTTSLNNIMTSSLCVPQKQNVSMNTSKPKKSRKKKPDMISHFTQTSPEIPHLCNYKRSKENIVSLTEIQSVKNSYPTLKFLSEHTVRLNATTTDECRIVCASHEPSRPENQSTGLHSIINSLKTIRLIADQEMISSNISGIPPEFWNEDFVNIIMSKSVWDSVVDW